MEKTAKLTNNKAIKTLKNILSSKFYPFITAGITLLCYYLGWDIVIIYFIAVTGILILLLLDDITPIISALLFLTVTVSLKNSPSPEMGNSNYYFRTEILVPLMIALVLFLSAGVFRIIKAIATGKFTLSPVFFGLCLFVGLLFINGLCSNESKPKNLLYGLIMAACFLGIYCAIKDNLKLDKDGFERIAFGFLAFSALLMIELIVAYCTTENLFENGQINRSKLIFGWGVYNTFGVFLVMCIPSVIYLAGKLKHGYLLTAYSVLTLVAAFLSCSRQSMIGAVVIYIVGTVLLLVKGKNRIPNVCIISACVAVVIVLMIVFREKVNSFFKIIFDNIIVNSEFDGSGRMALWREALEKYISAPLFGVGFYTEFSYYAKSGLGFIPHMCHNTILQLMSCTGTFGLLAYAIHRIQTIVSYVKNRTMERTFIALTISALLIICLFDNHIFNIYPTIIYSCLVAVLDKSAAPARSELLTDFHSEKKSLWKILCGK